METEEFVSEVPCAWWPIISKLPSFSASDACVGVVGILLCSF